MKVLDLNVFNRLRFDPAVFHTHIVFYRKNNYIESEH